MMFPAKIDAATEVAPKMLAAVWACVSDELDRAIGEGASGLWIRPLSLASVSEESTLIGVPNEIYEVWIQENYLDDLNHALAMFLENHGAVAFRSKMNDNSVTIEEPQALPDTAVKQESSILRQLEAGHSLGNLPQPPQSEGPKIPHHSPDLGDDAANVTRFERRGLKAGLSIKFRAESFIIGDNSKVAHAAASAVVDKPASQYNPLFICGEPGIGKTHLLNMIGWAYLEKNPTARVLYISSNDFMNDFVEALQKNALTALRKRYRSVDILLIDDVQFFGGKFGMQDEFFHVFNAVVESHKQLVMTSDRPAAEIPEMERRLVTRFHWGMTAKITAPDRETRMAILRRKREEWHGDLYVSDEQIEMIAERFTSDVRLMEGALLQVATVSSMNGGSLAQHELDETLSGFDNSDRVRDISVSEIIRFTAKHHDFEERDLTSRGRTQKLAWVRHMAMFLSKEMTTLSLKEIGRAFGGRDHGTIIHGVRRIRDEISSNAKTKRTVDFLLKEIERGDGDDKGKKRLR